MLLKNILEKLTLWPSHYELHSEKKSAKYRPFQIASFMQEVEISRNKTS